MDFVLKTNMATLLEQGLLKAGVFDDKPLVEKPIEEKPFLGFPEVADVPKPQEAGGDAFSSAVLSSASIEEDVKPDLEAEVTDFSHTGVEVDDEGVERFADGQVVETKDEQEKFLESLHKFNEKFGRELTDATGIKRAPGGGIDVSGAFDAETGEVIGGTRVPSAAETEEEIGDSEEQLLIDEAKRTLDAATKKSIDSIETLFNLRRTQQREINRRAEAAIKAGLISSGSFRFARISSPGVMKAKETAGLNAILALDLQEKSLIDEALAAQSAGDFKLLEARLGLAKEKRLEKQAKAIEVQKEMEKQAKKLEERRQQIEKDTNIASIMAEGITNPLEIFASLKLQGVDITSEEVADTLKNLEITDEKISELTGDAKEFQSFINLGLIDKTKSIQDQWKDYLKISTEDKLLSVTEAEKLGVAFGTTESQAFGIVPKKTGEGEISAKTITQIDRISSSFDTSPIVKQFNEVQNKLMSVSNIIDAGVGGPGDLALVFEFMKALDPTSVVRESEYAAAARSGNIFAGIWTRFNKGFFAPEGGLLPEEVKKSFLKLVGVKYNAVEAQYDNLRNEKARLIDIKTDDTDGKDYLINYKQVALPSIEDKGKENYFVNTSKGTIDLSTFEE